MDFFNAKLFYGFILLSSYIYIFGSVERFRFSEYIYLYFLVLADRMKMTKSITKCKAKYKTSLFDRKTFCTKINPR